MLTKPKYKNIILNFKIKKKGFKKKKKKYFYRTSNKFYLNIKKKH